MAHLVTFPWIDREEVKSVYDELFSSDVNLKRPAVDRISVWKCRVMERLPTAIESTSVLIKAEIEFEQMTLTHEAELYLRNMYSMALIRFVNHITERGQQYTYARPVHIVAAEFGVPEWIVELRHEATHGALPSLNALRAAAKWAIFWLKEQFWDHQVSDTFGLSTLQSAAVEILEDSLVNFMQRRFQEMAGGGETPGYKQLLCNIEHMCEQLRSFACTTLLQDGYLIFTEQQLTCLGLNSTEIFDSKKLLLPTKLVQFWQKIIRILCKVDLVGELLLHMSTLITEVPSLRNSLLCGWIYTIIWHNCPKKIRKSDLLDQTVDLPYKSLLEKCLHSLNTHKMPLVNLIVDRADLSLSQRKQIKQVLAIMASPTETDGGSDEMVHTVRDVVQDDRNSKWEKCMDLVSWSKLPFGTLQDQNIKYATFELGYCVSSEASVAANVEQGLTNTTTDNPQTSKEIIGEVADEMDSTKFDCYWDKATFQQISDNLLLF